MSGVRQWGRLAKVIIGKSTAGLLVENLRIKFDVVKTVDFTPNTATIQIYNLSPNSQARISNEFDEVQVFAGYQGTVPQIFRGNIVRAQHTREVNDHITTIEAADGDHDFRTAVMNETLSAGTTSSQLIDRAVASFKGVGDTTKGFVDIPNTALFRGKVMSGNTRDVLHNVAKEHGSNWSIQDGQLIFVKTNGKLPNEAVVLRSDTGLISTPEVDDKGIALTCLLNPTLRINGAVKLDNNALRYKVQKERARSVNFVEIPTTPVKLDKDGIYKVLRLEHLGDTHGNEWISKVECIGIGS